jgi:TolB-like protein
VAGGTIGMAKTVFLALGLLGEFVARDGAGQLLTIAARKNRALLAALALAPSNAMPRERIARLLWSDRADEQARSSLRQALASLRKDLAVTGASPIVATESRIKLDPDLTDVDAVLFQRLATSTDVQSLRDAADLYRGELLADLEIRNSAFEDWVGSERRRLSDIAARVFEKLWAHETGAARVDIAKRLVALDPLRESSHRKLIQAYAEVGEKALALRQYENCRDMLRAEFDVAPGEETDALRQGIQNDTVERARTYQSGDSSEVVEDMRAEDKPSVAVLPFDVIAEEGELEVFCDGLIEDITTGLSRIKAIRVVARNTMFRYKGQPVDIRSLGRELGVRYILEGSVRKFGARIRVSAQLIDAVSGNHVWAGRIDRTGSDMFELQDEITSSIVASVQTQLILSEGRIANTIRPESASNLLARSWQQFLNLTEQSLASSKRLAERALSIDGDSGMAHRMLAVSTYHQVYMGFVPWTDAAIDYISSHARLSIDAEDVDEYSHWAMECAFLLKKEHAHAMASLRRALDINPHCSLAHGSIGTVLAWAGESDNAIKNNELALRINPDDPSNFFRHLGLALAHYLASRYDQALHHATSVVQVRPQWWLGQLLIAASAAKTGRLEDASRTLDELEVVRPGLNCELLSVLPFANARDREHLMEGLRKAGLPQRQKEAFETVR